MTDSLWIASYQASLSFIISWSLPKLMSIESVMSSNHLILCHPLLLPPVFPSIRIFSNESSLESGGQSVGISASGSVLPMNIQGWFLLQLTGLICLQSKGLSSLLQHHNLKASVLQYPAFFMVFIPWSLYLLYTMTTGKTIGLTRWTFVGKVMFLPINTLSMFVINFLPSSKCLLIS